MGYLNSCALSWLLRVGETKRVPADVSPAHFEPALTNPHGLILSIIDNPRVTQEEKASLDHILCLVDARENMFEVNDEGQSYFSVALQIIHRVLRTKIINW